jgi:hypothetical protein
MPPEQDDHRAREIEAMRRYFASLGTELARAPVRTGPPLPAPGPTRRPSLPWLLATIALVIAGLVGGVLIGAARGADRRAGTGASSGSAGATSGSLAAPVATPACKTAVDRANRSLALAVRVQGALRDYTQIMSELRDGRIDASEAVRRATPSLTIGSVTSAQFDGALADYQRIVDQCRLRAP